MAWRIDEAVVRGEIDNRQRGRVTGRIWFLGREQPVELDLAGDAWRDVAGRRIEFVNPAPKAMDLVRFPGRQTGVIGDCTASRKVKVPDIPMDQIGEYYAAKKKWTWHWGNSLYLEWFSVTNGRVVIESASYQLTVDPEIKWEMSAEEEEQQRRGNAEAMTNFMERLAAAADATAANEAIEKTADPDDFFANEKRRAEAETIDIDAENEELLDRIGERMEQEGPDADFEKIMQEELDRRRRERGDPPLNADEEEARTLEIEAMNRSAAESVSELGSDEEDDEDEEDSGPHPLAERAHLMALRLGSDPKAAGWLAEAPPDHPLRDMGGLTSKAAAKLTALSGGDWPPPLDICEDIIAALKAARTFLDQALLAAEVCRRQEIAAPSWITTAEREITSVAHDCDVIIGELRARLARGFD